jgi:hypothetical protein
MGDKITSVGRARDWKQWSEILSLTFPGLW